MIDAKEIRLGIWVDIYGPTQLDEDLLEVLFSARDYESLNPIPLTPEILIACGFKNAFKDNWLNGEIELQYYELGNWYELLDGAEGGTFPAEIRYLHQLQNLYFALTNKELTYTPLTKTIPSESNTVTNTEEK